MRTTLALLFFVFAAGCGDGSDAETPETAGPQIVSVDADALQRDLAALDADLVVLNVWATWCGPCRAEFPEFVRFGREQADEGVAVRFLTVDDAEMLPRAQEFLYAHGVSGPSYFSSVGSNIVSALVAPQRWGYGIPTTLIYDGDGRLVDAWEGAVTYDFLSAKVEQARDAAPARSTSS